MIFGDFGSKTRENIDFLPIYKDLQEILWSKVLLPHFEYFLSKKFLSSLEFSNYDTCTSSQAHGALDKIHSVAPVYNIFFNFCD